MECLMALCLYVDIALGVHESDKAQWLRPAINRQAEIVDSPDTPLARVTVGTESETGYYVEFEHFSSIRTRADYGFNGFWAGKRWRF